MKFGIGGLNWIELNVTGEFNFVPHHSKIIVIWSWNKTSYFFSILAHCTKYWYIIRDGRLQSSWTHLVTPSRNFVEVRWRYLFRSTSLGKQCTSYNAPPTYRKRAADCWSLRNFLPRSSPFTVGKVQKLHGASMNWILCSAWKKWISETPLEHPPYRPDLTPCDFWAFPTMKREPQSKKFRSHQRSAARFREVGGALWEVHRLPRDVLRKRDRHRTSTKFRHGVIRWVHELCKRPS
jgi:hypothetical protein